MQNQQALSLRSGRSADSLQYETAFPVSFPWRRETPEDAPRFARDADGWWRDPHAPKTGRALVSMAGDCICEPRVHQANRYGDTYFFHPCFQYVRPLLKQSDFVLGNLETTITDLTPYAGEYHKIAGQYHCNAPAAFLDALRYAGFDAFGTANNHDLDSGVMGLADTLQALDARGLLHTGVFLPGDPERAMLVEIRGIRVGVLAFTNRHNRREPNLTQAGQDCFLNTYTPEKAQQDAAWARARGAEFIICCIHWGAEHVFEAAPEQLREAQELADAGVDYIMGSHSHCLQRHTTVTAKDGRRVNVQFSVGNFVTNASFELNRTTGIVQLGLRRENGRITAQEWFVPCRIMDSFGTGRFTVVPVSAALNGGAEPAEFGWSRDFAEELLGDSLPFRTDHGMKARDLRDICGADVRCAVGGSTVTGCCTDPADARPGTLYVDLRGSRGDILEAKQKGAQVVLSPLKILDFPSTQVKDPAACYVKTVQAMRGRFPAQSVRIAGQGGKTLTAKMTAYLLEKRWYVYAPKDAPHIPMDAWTGLHPFHDWDVEEFRSADAQAAALEARAHRPAVWAVLDDLGLSGEALEQYLLALESARTLLLNADDPVLMQAAKALPQSAPVRFFTGGEAGAARAIGLLAGLSEEETALTGFDGCDYTHCELDADGVRLLLRTTCKRTRDAARACALLPDAADTLAVFGSLDGEPAGECYRQLIAACGAARVILYGPELCAWEDAAFEKAQTPAELETLLAGTLQAGQTLLLCGGRRADFGRTVRRMFGLCDGFIAEEYL